MTLSSHHDPHTTTPPRNGETDVVTAQLACMSCKTRKIKCDKALPKCSSCTRRRVACEYTNSPRRDVTLPSAAACDSYWHNPLRDGDRPTVQSIDLSTLSFLDPNILRYGQIETPRVSVPTTKHIMQLLGDDADIKATASNFFEHIHSWMPFLSRTRFYDVHLTASLRDRPTVALLLLALKLITTLPPTSPQSPRTALYHTTKHSYLEVESFSILSIVVLQAGVLVALYELGHVIYPAAFLSIGACARYAHAMGIGVSSDIGASRVLTLSELEERRRVWWAIVILDRFVSIGCPGRPFTTADPNMSDLLPVNDEAWDQGVVRSEDSFSISCPSSSHMSKFALLCQAASLLGQVLDHHKSDSTDDEEVSVQLDRTLQAMVTASLDPPRPDYDQIAFVYSVLLSLHSPWLSPNPPSPRHADRINRAKAVIHIITDRITTNLVEQQCFLGRDPNDVSPWGLFFAYKVCGVHMRARHPTSAEKEVVRSLRETFVSISVRWNVASVYLKLLEAQEVLRVS